MSTIVSHVGSGLENLEERIFEIQNHLRTVIAPDKLPWALDLLDQLTQFEFGKWVLMNGGLNAYWTHWLILQDNVDKKKLKPLETFFLQKSPTANAARERFEIFQTILQSEINSRAGISG